LSTFRRRNPERVSGKHVRLQFGLSAHESFARSPRSPKNAVVVQQDFTLTLDLDVLWEIFGCANTTI